MRFYVCSLQPLLCVMCWILGVALIVAWTMNKPSTDEQVFLDKFPDEFSYVSVRRTSFP